jgi:hypothetical protein
VTRNCASAYIRTSVMRVLAHGNPNRPLLGACPPQAGLDAAFAIRSPALVVAGLGALPGVRKSRQVTTAVMKSYNDMM